MDTIPGSLMAKVLARADANADTAEYSYTMTADRRAMIAVGVVFTSIGVITMVLRLMSTFIRHRPIGKDDYSMLLAWLSMIAFATAQFISVRWGSGYSTTDVPPYWTTMAVKAVYVVEIFYYFSLFFVKTSILMLYLRLVADLRTVFYWGTITTLAIVVLHFISTVIVVGVQCIPMEKYWNPTVEGHCISILAFFYSTNIFTIITDVIIIALPVHTLWKLNTPKRQKFGIMGAFAMGGISTIASCVRLYSVRVYGTSTDPLKDSAPIGTWSFIEINLAILCCSAPALKPLFMPRDNLPNPSYDSSPDSSLKRNGASGSGIAGFFSRTADSKSKSLSTTQATELDLVSVLRESDGPAPGGASAPHGGASYHHPHRHNHHHHHHHAAPSGGGAGGSRVLWTPRRGDDTVDSPLQYDATVARHAQRKGSRDSFGSQQILVETTFEVDDKPMRTREEVVSSSSGKA